MKLASLVLCSTLATVPALADDPKPPAKKPQAIPALMRDAHMKGRQLYRSLDMLLISGRSTADERKKFIETYAALRELKPPQGKVESWQFDIDRILDIAKQMDAAPDVSTALEAGTKLLHATNCTACHEKYRYAPKAGPNEIVPKSLAVGVQALATGGRYWSAPASLDLGNVKYLQPGRRLIVWPAEDAVYEARRGDRDTASFSVRFKWALPPGGALPQSDLGLLWYNSYDLGNNNVSSYYHARPDFKAREGEFTESFTVRVKGREPGEYELAFVPQVNGTVWVPASNFLKLKYRLPK